MFLRFPTYDGKIIAVNPDFIRGIQPRDDGYTMLAFGAQDWIDIGLPFDETVRRLNDAMTAGV